MKQLDDCILDGGSDQANCQHYVECEEENEDEEIDLSV
jgi:hypothetical protein